MESSDVPGQDDGTRKLGPEFQKATDGSLSQTDSDKASGQTEISIGENENVEIVRKFSEGEPITYSWENITAWTGKLEKEGQKVTGICKYFRPKNKRILNNVSGVARPTEILTILGSSGAGKSTLLDVLSFRNSHKIKVSGKRGVNGCLVKTNIITATSAYVQQADLFFGVLTVSEHLIFQARVRMHSHIPHAERMKRVKQVIQEFELEKCADTQIGTKWFKGISGGEMKRLAIASEVLTSPTFICLDEPTSGLDSATSQSVMTILKKLASRGKTVICTIHQPSSQLFALFDKILLMADGRVAFLGTPTGCISFFSKLGYMCPAMFNPSDFWVETLAIRDSETREAVHKICDSFDWSTAGLPTIDVEQSYSVDSQRRKARSRYKASWFSQFRAVLRRSWKAYFRDPVVMPLRMGQNIILAIFLGAIYFQLDVKTNSGVENLVGAIFVFLSLLTYQHVLGTLDSFTSELPVFFREHHNGMYRTDVYFICKILVEIPFYIIQPLVFTAICHLMIGLYPDVWNFSLTVLIMVLLTNIFSAMGQFLSCMATSVTMALLLASVFIFPFFLFGGFLVQPGTGPYYLKWIEKISFYFYGYEGLAIVQLELLRNITCDNPQNDNCPKNGTDVLASRGLNEENLPLDVSMLGILALVWEILAFLVLLCRTFRQ